MLVRENRRLFFTEEDRLNLKVYKYFAGISFQKKRYTLFVLGRKVKNMNDIIKEEIENMIYEIRGK